MGFKDFVHYTNIQLQKIKHVMLHWHFKYFAVISWYANVIYSHQNSFVFI